MDIFYEAYDVSSDPKKFFAWWIKLFLLLETLKCFSPSRNAKLDLNFHFRLNSVTTETIHDIVVPEAQHQNDTLSAVKNIAINSIIDCLLLLNDTPKSAI